MRGLIRERLNDFGTYPESSDELIIFVNTGKSSSMHDFSSHVGIGSNSQDLLGDLRMIAFTSWCVVGVKSVKYVSSCIWSDIST